MSKVSIPRLLGAALIAPTAASADAALDSLIKVTAQGSAGPGGEIVIEGPPGGVRIAPETG